IGFRNIDPTHCFTPIGFFSRSALPRASSHCSDPWRSICSMLIRSTPAAPPLAVDLMPGRLQRLSVTDQPVETIEAIALLLLGFCAQLRSPFTNFREQDCLSKSQFHTPLFCRRCFHQSVQCLSESACLTPGPLCGPGY